MAYTSPRTFVAGELETAAIFNAHVRDQFLAICSTTGRLTLTSFGVHSISGNGTGEQSLTIRNATAGTGNMAVYLLGNDTDASGGRLEYTSTTFTPAGFRTANAVMLSTDSSGGIAIAAAHANGTLRLTTGGTAVRATVNANGTQTWAAYGAGTATFDASGNITSVSDRRYKNRITALPYGLKEVLKLRPVTHGYNARSGLDRKHLYAGFIAQDVKRAGVALAVGRNAAGYLTLADRPILGATVHAIQTLHSRLQRLERHQRRRRHATR